MGHPAIVIPLRCADADSYDPDALRLGRDEIPTAKIERARGPGARPPGTACSSRAPPGPSWRPWWRRVSRGARWACGWRSACRPSSRASEWVRVRTHLRESLGFTNRAAHSRAVAELERAGLIEVQRRKGYAPLVRLVAQQRREGDRDDG